MNAHTKPSAIVPVDQSVVPQGYDDRDEMVAIRKLLRLGRIDEAKTRLDLWLNWVYPSWRTLA